MWRVHSWRVSGGLEGCKLLASRCNTALKWVILLLSDQLRPEMAPGVGGGQEQGVSVGGVVRGGKYPPPFSSLCVHVRPSPSTQNELASLVRHWVPHFMSTIICDWIRRF